MLKKIIHRILLRRHFWRTAGFDELTELYLSSMLRTFAVSVLMVFVPFYLYQNGYSVQQIFLFYGYYFLGKTVSDIASGFFIARFGPKHSMVVSSILQIITAALFLSLPDMHWPLFMVGFIFGSAASFFFIAFHVDFSKIKHSAHSGKEIGSMQIFEKAAAVAGPIVGGFAGNFLGSQYIFLIASAVLFASLWPLFRTAEPVRLRQKLSFRDLPLHKLRRDYLSYGALGVENTLCINLWPLYLSLFALGGSVYAKLGALSSIGVLASIVSAYMIGRYIDTKDARKLLRIAALANASVYFIRPFVHSLAPALLTNVANEVITTGYRMPYLKGMYAAADDLPGHRIVYIATMEALGSICKGTAWFFLAAIAIAVPPYAAIITGFVIAGCSSLIVPTERFRALKA